jgi:hypothetical protein
MSAASFSPEQIFAVRQAYSDAFAADMRVCAIVAGACIVLTLGTVRQNPPSVADMRKERFIDEKRLSLLREVAVAKFGYSC